VRRTVFIQRSIDGKILYFRPAPDKRWDLMVDEPGGSRYTFQELQPGEGRFFHITPARPPKR